MSSSTTFTNALIVALDSVVSRIEAGELRRRADDAARIQLLADAFDTVAAESSGTRETSTPRGPVE